MPHNPKAVGTNPGLDLNLRMLVERILGLAVFEMAMRALRTFKSPLVFKLSLEWLHCQRLLIAFPRFALVVQRQDFCATHQDSPHHQGRFDSVPTHFKGYQVLGCIWGGFPRRLMVGLSSPASKMP